MRLTSWLCAVPLVLGSFAGPAQARSIKGHEFPEEINIGGHTVKLLGLGLRTKWFFKVYAMGAYQVSPTKGKNPERWSAANIVRAKEAKLIWIKMLRTIGAEKMRDAIDEGFQNNSGDKLPALKERLEKFKTAFPESIKEGMNIAIAYVPGRGTSVSFDESVKVTIPGADFMGALWRVWFGKDPADGSLKKAILKVGE